MSLLSITTASVSLLSPAETRSLSGASIALDKNSNAHMLSPVEQSPGVQVALSPGNASPATSPIYSKPAPAPSFTETTYLREQNPAGIAGASIARALMSSLDNMKAEKTPLTVSSLFNQVGALSRETNFYSNEARRFRVPAGTGAEKFSPDFTNFIGRYQESVALSIRTKEGDTININVVRKGEGNSLAFSFAVDGELSEEEQKSLDKLMTKLGDVADEFFRTGTAGLRGLEDIDSKTIKSFSLTLTIPKADDYVSLNYEYSVDDATQTRQLSGSDIDGYSFDIKANINGLLQQKNPDAVRVLEQYLDLIRQAGDKHDTQSQSVRFMVDALRSVLMPRGDLLMAAGHSTEATLTNFDSGLADFTAHFTSPVVYNRENRSQVSALSLSMGQTTRTETIADRTIIQQTMSYELHNNHFARLPGMAAADLSNGNYIYEQEHIKESMTRTLDMKAGRVNDVIVEKTFAREYTEIWFNNFHQVDQHNEADEDHQLVNLIDQLYEPELSAAQNNLMMLINDTKHDLFRH